MWRLNYAYKPLFENGIKAFIASGKIIKLFQVGVQVKLPNNFIFNILNLIIGNSFVIKN